MHALETPYRLASSTPFTILRSAFISLQSLDVNFDLCTPHKPRIAFIFLETGSRCFGLQHFLFLHKWSRSNDSDTIPKNDSYAKRCALTSLPFFPDKRNSPYLFQEQCANQGQQADSPPDLSTLDQNLSFISVIGRGIKSFIVSCDKTIVTQNIDDTTVSWTSTLTTDAAGLPITGSDPAG